MHSRYNFACLTVHCWFPKVPRRSVCHYTTYSFAYLHTKSPRRLRSQVPVLSSKTLEFGLLLGRAVELTCEDSSLKRLVCSASIQTNWSFQTEKSPPATDIDLSIAELPARAPRLPQLGECSASNPCVSWKLVNSGSRHVPHHDQRSIHLP